MGGDFLVFDFDDLMDFTLTLFDDSLMYMSISRWNRWGSNLRCLLGWPRYVDFGNIFRDQNLGIFDSEIFDPWILVFFFFFNFNHSYVFYERKRTRIFLIGRILPRWKFEDATWNVISSFEFHFEIEFCSVILYQVE